jgi:hypothetical protein
MYTAILPPKKHFRQLPSTKNITFIIYIELLQCPGWSNSITRRYQKFRECSIQKWNNNQNARLWAASLSAVSQTDNNNWTNISISMWHTLLCRCDSYINQINRQCGSSHPLAERWLIIRYSKCLFSGASLVLCIFLNIFWIVSFVITSSCPQFYTFLRTVLWHIHFFHIFLAGI